jgi:hypothetical protein
MEIDWRHIITGLAILNALALWWNNIVMQEIQEDCGDLLAENRTLKASVEVLKAGRR